MRIRDLNVETFKGLDELNMLPIDHNESPDQWFATEVEYEEDTLIHIHPNKGAHYSDMITIDGLDFCLCDCELGYDKTGEGSMRVIHNYDPTDLSTG